MWDTIKSTNVCRTQSFENTAFHASHISFTSLKAPLRSLETASQLRETNHMLAFTRMATSGDVQTSGMSGGSKKDTPRTTSPTKSTPRFGNSSTSTLLYKRFLNEVSMVRTPQRTPSPVKAMEKTKKGGNSPMNGRSSPSKPTLEVGRDGFYFSYELPLSKVSPKKDGTKTSLGKVMMSTGNRERDLKKDEVSIDASRDIGAKSPEKNKPTFTSRQNPATKDMQKGTNDLEVFSANMVLKNRQSISRIPKQYSRDLFNTKTECAIGEPGTPTITHTSNTSALQNKRTNLTRKESFNIGQLMIGLKAHPPANLWPAVEKYAGETDVSGGTTLLQTATKNYETVTPIKKSDNLHKCAKTVLPNAKATLRTLPVAQIHIDTSLRNKDLLLQYSPLLFLPREPEAKQELNLGLGENLRFSDYKQVGRRSSLPTFSRTSGTGTDPRVFRAMCREMGDIKLSLSSSLGLQVTLSGGKKNTFELPTMGDPLLKSVNDEAVAKKSPRLIRSATTRSSMAKDMVSVRDHAQIPPTNSPDREPKGQKRQAEAVEKSKQHSLPTSCITSKSTLNKTNSTPSRLKSTIHSNLAARTKPLSSIPRSARRNVFDVPASHTLFKKPPPKKSKPTASQPTSASALDIASVITEWNTTPSSNQVSNEEHDVKTPTKHSHDGIQTTQFNFDTPFRTYQPFVPVPMLKTPARRVLRARGQGTPGTDMVDVNATRTPSKEIERSLDAAIDAKISADKKMGKREDLF
ncbi:hypothetical protein GQ44DRAFT_310994 [Phaeosphaeriaceae sp. PMI808]|nr:hypothetical protein GQ44DRAFT_310994 [Phaeosphaeriaceae sp. PMI808]